MIRKSQHANTKFRQHVCSIRIVLDRLIIAMLIAVDEPDGVHWRVGYNNFYVITRYNRSAYYAAAVNDLAKALREAQSAGK